MILHKKFIKSIAWNAAGSVLYYLLFMLHQSFLFSVMSREDYGRAGMLFSSLYLLTGLLDGGLDASFSPFLTVWSRSRKDFRYFMKGSIVPTFVLTLSTLMILYIIKPFYSAFSPTTYLPFFLLVSACVLFEMIRKALRILLQLIFKYRTFAAGELIFILIYMGIFWTPWFFGNPVNVWGTLQALLLSSIIACLFLGYVTLAFYRSLPEDSSDSVFSPSWKRIARTRVAAWIHFSATALFSGNFLVPLFAARFGFVAAAVFKLVSTLVQGTVSIIRKVFTAAGSALFAHSKHESPEQHQVHFSLATHYLYQTLYALFIFALINHALIAHSAQTTSANFYFIMISIVLNLSEIILIMHEQYLIAHEKAELLAFSNCFLALLCALIIYGFPTLSPNYALTIITVLRLTSATAIALFAFHSRNLITSWRPRTPVLIFSVLISLLFLLVSKSKFFI